MFEAPLSHPAPIPYRRQVSGPTPATLPPSPAPRARGWALAWLAGLLPLLLIAGSIYGYLNWWKPNADAADAYRAATAGPPAPTTVEPGKDYYVFIRTLEVYSVQPGGHEWDRGGGSAPDLWYQLVWQGKTVFESDTRDNGFVALWDPINLDVREALLGSGKLELAATFNQGAIVNVASGQTLEVIVYDSDPLGRERAGSATLSIEMLLEGDNTFTFEETESNAIKRMVMSVTATDQPVANLLEALGAPGP